ncbi:MAG: signal peptidase I [Acidobacteriota bacterium]|nr:signal peptidase I [Acidobacteriota bacterium]
MTEERPEGPRGPERQEGALRVWTESILVAVILLQFVNAFVLQTFFIPSGSMEDTLLVGDHLFVNRFIYGPPEPAGLGKWLPHRPVQRGDIVVFESVEEPGVDVIKRCVAVAGDTVELRGQTLRINGEAIDESAYAIYREEPGDAEMDSRLRSFLQRKQSFPNTLVPPGHVFCLGDNRNHSNDSRFWGPLPLNHVEGRAWLIYWSYGGEGYESEQQGLLPRIRRLLRTLVGLPTKTRWGRSFQVIR